MAGIPIPVDCASAGGLNIPARAVGSGSLVLGSPAHLTVLVEFAEEQQRQDSRPE
jgi:hypothetical protein